MILYYYWFVFFNTIETLSIIYLSRLQVSDNLKKTTRIHSRKYSEMIADSLYFIFIYLCLFLS